jgi:hypothetical protein
VVASNRPWHYLGVVSIIKTQTLLGVGRAVATKGTLAITGVVRGIVLVRAFRALTSLKFYGVEFLRILW